MAYLFSSESVSEGHPDKVADQISDALLDQFLAYDDHAHCAIDFALAIVGHVTSPALAEGIRAAMMLS